MSSLLPHQSNARTARRAREQFVNHLQACLSLMGQAAHAHLVELASTVASPREMQDRRDGLLEFQKKGPSWLQATAKAWQKAVEPQTATARVRMESVNLELIGDEVVEQKIIASRLALSIQEKATWELNDLKVRMQHLDGEEQAGTDILRPEALCLVLVEQWSAAGLGATPWTLVHEVVQRTLREHVPAGYGKTNEFLIKQGVMRDIDLTSRVRRTAASQAAQRSDRGGPPSELPDESQPSGSSSGGAWSPGATDPGFSGNDAAAGHANSSISQARAGDGRGWDGSGEAFAPTALQPMSGDIAGRSPRIQPRPRGTGGHGIPGGSAGGRAQGGSAAGSTGFAGEAGHSNGAGAPQSSGPMSQPGSADVRMNRSRGDSSGASDSPGVSDETRLMTSSPPLARARQRASGVLGQLKRLLIDRVAGFESSMPPTRPSTDLAEAMAQQVTQVQATVAQAARSGSSVYDDAAVHEVATDLRRRTGELKKKAATSTEKATIEIVALMFQSILAEERIPPGIRVWFARLQMPVLRVALSEPEFFGTLEHPARQLIDRMGSVVLGFDSASVGDSALEAEIKRVVQVIEQYPETGRRVFQLVYEEFQKFLSKYLAEKGPTRKLVSVAQQVEQKETLAIQYTIEMRSMLSDIPVREEIREFLFKVWAEVLAVAAVRHGPQHAETLSLKSAASELVWAASAKPNRAERARVIQDLPKLLQRLRQGMSLVGVEGKAQEAHIKTIGDTLADAFLSKTEAIPQARIEQMSKRLAHLEDYVADDPATDLPLDAESIEMMLGIDASDIEVVADGGTNPNAAMLGWAAELQVGTWFTLDHNGAIAQVQYVWQSDRKQLHLFAAASGRSYLIQARRLAAYLQAGLLLPAEEEALTVRATRDALAKLDANPERLLQ